jgi:hypothetical protein
MNWKQVNLRTVLKSVPFWGAPALLSIVALTQVGESSIGTLTHWKGGGFGMFSTSDSVDARFIKAYILSDKGEVPVTIPDIFSSEEVQLQTWPRQMLLSNLASEMSKVSWLVAPTTRPGLLTEANRSAFPALSIPANRPKMVIASTKPDQYPAKYVRINVTGIRLEVWKTRMDANGTLLNSTFVMSATVACSLIGSR